MSSVLWQQEVVRVLAYHGSRAVLQMTDAEATQAPRVGCLVETVFGR